jgi:arylsulfatase A-like enzyme
MRSWVGLVAAGFLPVALGFALIGCGSPDESDDVDPNFDEGKADSSGPCTSCSVILMVWDGLRPDLILDPMSGSCRDPQATPHLCDLAARGVWFSDHHSTYPTFTMMNASSLASGDFPAKTGFYGNTFWQPGPTGHDAGGNPVDFEQPTFTEDYSILRAADAFYQGHLLLVPTLFQAAQAAGLRTAAVGKSGPAFLQDRLAGGVVIDEKMALPLAFAQRIQQTTDPATGQPYALPRTTAIAYDAGAITLASANGDPTAAGPRALLADSNTPDPSDAAGNPFGHANEYLVNVFRDVILADRATRPHLAVVWIRNPDATQHTYGLGTANAWDALRHQDHLLGLIEDRLTELGIAGQTDLIVVSDHGHSNVSGPQDLFPLRGVANRQLGAIDTSGYSVSGDVRTADLLRRAGFSAYDGQGCLYDPVLSGTMADSDGNAVPVYPAMTDSDGSVCGMAGRQYVTPAYRVPTAPLAPGALIVAANGGSDYIYAPDHDPVLVARVLSFLQSREEFGAILLASRYGALPGTLPMDAFHLEDGGDGARHPDIIVSMSYDEYAVVQGLPGTTFSGFANQRGMHGGFGPIDVHNTLAAVGPHFRRGVTTHLPSGNVDVAPTIARILGVAFDDTDGRPLVEGLRRGAAETRYPVRIDWNVSDTVDGLEMKLPTNADGRDVDPYAQSYTIGVQMKSLSYRGTRRYYFDYAQAFRQ